MSSQPITPNTEAAILARLIQARDRMTPDVAQYLLSFDFDAEDTERMNSLAEKAREGNLMSEEKAELDSYLHIGSLIFDHAVEGPSLSDIASRRTSPTVNPLFVQEIWQRANHRCEYCRMPYPHYRLPSQIDHIIARQHGGATASDNLARACYHCNRFKGPNNRGA